MTMKRREVRKENASKKADALITMVKEYVMNSRHNILEIDRLGALLGCSDHLAKMRVIKAFVYLNNDIQNKFLINELGTIRIAIDKIGFNKYQVSFNRYQCYPIIEDMLKAFGYHNVERLSPCSMSVASSIDGKKNLRKKLEDALYALYDKVDCNVKSKKSELKKVDEEISRLITTRNKLEYEIAEFEKKLEDEDLIADELLKVIIAR